MAIHKNLAGRFVEGISAAGTTAATAATVDAKHSMVETITEATARGVILSDSMADREEWGTVHNASSSSLDVYPPTGGAWNGSTTDIYLTLPPYSGMVWVKFASTKFGVIYS